MDDIALSQAIAEAAGRTDVRAAVRRVYNLLQEEIDRRRPVCRASGRCCRFEEYGHRLYVTTIELAVFSEGLRSEPQAAKSVADSRISLPVIRDSAGCIFQVDGLCSVHAIRPFGCRIFFCDETAEQWQQAQYERFHAELKRAHEALNVPYFYVEWRQGLAAMQAALAEPRA